MQATDDDNTVNVTKSPVVSAVGPDTTKFHVGDRGGIDISIMAD